MNRRKFLLIATGSTAALGIGGKLSIDALGLDQSKKTTGKSRRWAMLIDLEKCSKEGAGCDKCIKACHSAHNVPDFGNKKDEVKWIWKEKFDNAFIEQENELLPEKVHNLNVPLMCNHCANPPCTNVCPTKATWQREDGIVMMDWHRCIGCRYCVAACPYGSRSFNWREPREFIKNINDEYPTRMRGVVEKCTFCAERLAKGEKPACSEACPAKAMIFGDLNDSRSEIRKTLREIFSMKRKAELGTKPEVYYKV
jgi:molybdopterin-containing oxidoreductase family iron-sulfur binding subunit